MTEEATKKEVSTSDPSKGIAALKQVLMDEKLRHTDTELQLAMTRIELQEALQQIDRFRDEAKDEANVKAGNEVGLEDGDLEVIDGGITD